MMDEEILLEKALGVISEKIVEITKEYSTEKDQKKIDKIKEKLELLKRFRREIYKGNQDIINKVIKENKKGVI